jgi:hypothetical protein
MPGRGKVGGHGRGKGHGGGDPSGSESIDPGRPDSPGRSEWAPGHMKRAAGEQSARDFAPGHGGEPPGQRGKGNRGPELGRAERDGQDEVEPLT